MKNTSVQCEYFGECNSENNRDSCKNGTYFYRCAYLNYKTEEYYNQAIGVATAYPFDKLNFQPRDKWDFYNEREKNEAKGKACIDCRTNITEAFECRCAYLCGSGKCDKGGKDKIWGGSKFEILYYQLPISKDYQGKVDLVLWEKETKNIFLTEYKPNRTQSPEKLLRMICEIVTYRTSATEGCLQFFNHKFNDKRFKEKIICIAEENIHTAIMFNEFGDDDMLSPQKAEYEQKNGGIEALLKKHHVSVFELKGNKDIIMVEDNRKKQ